MQEGRNPGRSERVGGATGGGMKGLGRGLVRAGAEKRADKGTKVLPLALGFKSWEYGYLRHVIPTSFEVLKAGSGGGALLFHSCILSSNVFSCVVVYLYLKF